jgi:hypothetical protein
LTVPAVEETPVSETEVVGWDTNWPGSRKAPFFGLEA